MNEDLIKYIRSFGYMEGIDRSTERTKQYGEVFTHQHIAVDSVDRLEFHDPELFVNPEKIICDPACGDGMLLGEVLIRRLERGCNHEQAVLSLRGLDIHPDNIERCLDRLCWTDNILKDQMRRYIIVGDGLKNSYSFGDTVKFGNGLFEEL